MKESFRIYSLVLVVFSCVFFASQPLFAQVFEPPYFGPPGDNTLPALVDGVQAWPRWSGGEINFANPWTECSGVEAFNVIPSMSGEVYNRFEHYLGSFVFNALAGGYPVGGDFTSPDGNGTAMLEKSKPGQAFYDQLRLTGERYDGTPVSWVIPLQEYNTSGGPLPDYIGVANIVVPGVIEECEGFDENSQFRIPLGRVDGQPAVILDVNGDGEPDDEFMVGPPVRGTNRPIIENVPTLSQAALAALALLMLMVGLYTLKNKGGGLPA